MKSELKKMIGKTLREVVKIYELELDDDGRGLDFWNPDDAVVTDVRTEIGFDVDIWVFGNDCFELIDTQYGTWIEKTDD